MHCDCDCHALQLERNSHRKTCSQALNAQHTNRVVSTGQTIAACGGCAGNFELAFDWDAVHCFNIFRQWGCLGLSRRTLQPAQPHSLPPPHLGCSQPALEAAAPGSGQPQRLVKRSNHGACRLASVRFIGVTGRLHGSEKVADGALGRPRNDVVADIIAPSRSVTSAATGCFAADTGRRLRLLV